MINTLRFDCVLRFCNDNQAPNLCPSVFVTRYVDQPAVPEKLVPKKLVHHTVITTVRSIKHESYLLLREPETSISLSRFHWFIAMDNASGDHTTQKFQFSQEGT